MSCTKYVTPRTVLQKCSPGFHPDLLRGNSLNFMHEQKCAPLNCSIVQCTGTDLYFNGSFQVQLKAIHSLTTLRNDQFPTIQSSGLSQYYYVIQLSIRKMED